MLIMNNMSVAGISFFYFVFSALKQAKINIISYGLISLRKNLNEALLKGISDAKFGVGIVDESHFIKCRKTTRTQKITELLRQVKRVILLTGTPSLARPEEVCSHRYAKAFCILMAYPCFALGFIHLWFSDLLEAGRPVEESTGNVIMKTTSKQRNIEFNH